MGGFPRRAEPGDSARRLRRKGPAPPVVYRKTKECAHAASHDHRREDLGGPRGLGRGRSGPAHRVRSGPGARQRHHGPHRHQGVPQDWRRARLRRREDCPRARPLRAEQGHQKRRADQDAARFRARAGHRALLRGRLHGRRACAAARAGRRDRRRPHHRCGLAHLHLRSARRVLHGRGLHGRRGGLCHRPRMVQGAGIAQVRDRGRAAPGRHRQGHHPLHHRHDRRGRRAVQGHGVHGQRHPQPVHGRPPRHLQHGHRGGRQGRHHRGGRRHARLYAGPHGAPGRGVPL